MKCIVGEGRRSEQNNSGRGGYSSLNNYNLIRGVINSSIFNSVVRFTPSGDVSCVFLATHAAEVKAVVRNIYPTTNQPINPNEFTLHWYIEMRRKLTWEPGYCMRGQLDHYSSPPQATTIYPRLYPCSGNRCNGVSNTLA